MPSRERARACTAAPWGLVAAIGAVGMPCCGAGEPPAGSEGDGPSRAVAIYTQHLHDGNFAAAYDLTSRPVRQLHPRDQWITRCEEFRRTKSSIAGFTPPVLLNRVDDLALVSTSYTIRAVDGAPHEEPRRVEVMLEDGQWRIAPGKSGRAVPPVFGEVRDKAALSAMEVAKSYWEAVAVQDYARAHGLANVKQPAFARLKSFEGDQERRRAGTLALFDLRQVLAPAIDFAAETGSASVCQVVGLANVVQRAEPEYSQLMKRYGVPFREVVMMLALTRQDGKWLVDKDYGERRESTPVADGPPQRALLTAAGEPQESGVGNAQVVLGRLLGAWKTANSTELRKTLSCVEWHNWGLLGAPGGRYLGPFFVAPPRQDSTLVDFDEPELVEYLGDRTVFQVPLTRQVRRGREISAKKDNRLFYLAREEEQWRICTPAGRLAGAGG